MTYINDCAGEFCVDLTTEPGGGRTLCQLIWGDFVHLTSEATDNHVQVVARASDRPGWVPRRCLTEDGLLEFYVIDVGQGDGALVRTPDDQWHVVDAGVSNSRQMTGKGAANFIRWKFRSDLQKPCALRTVVLTHPDFDHYGGLINLLSGDLEDGAAPFPVTVDRFLHSGMGRFDGRAALGRTARGEVDEFPVANMGLRRRDSFIVELLDDKNSFESGVGRYAGAYGDLAELIVSRVGTARRIGVVDGQLEWLPGYSPADGVTGPGATPLQIRVLGPVFETFTPSSEDETATAGLRQLASESVTRNGHSVLLRFDYGDARILLTGDLNAESQKLLLSYIPADEFAADVVKGCHHGSEDVDMRFLAAMKGRATVISSGDNEDYAHPRPVIMGASAFYGREIVTADGDRMPPLLYSTELARSTKLEFADRVEVDHDSNVATDRRSFATDQSRIRPKEGRFRRFHNTPIATNLIYGLVNIRTDGRRILCATLEEAGNEFDIKVFMAGQNPG